MQVILKENIIGLGFKDDVVTVKDGYGRNYLIPKQKAVIASKSALKMREEELKQRAKKLAKLLEDAEAQAAKVRALKPIVITARVSANGKIYGSVNAQQLVEAVAQQGYELDRKLVVVKDVKTIGDHAAQVHFHKEVIVELPFSVVAEGAQTQEAPKAEAATETAEA